MWIFSELITCVCFPFMLNKKSDTESIICFLISYNMINNWYVFGMSILLLKWIFKKIKKNYNILFMLHV